MTEDEAAECGYSDGESDGYAGNGYDAYCDAVPPEHEAIYRQEYASGYYDGQLAYRRTCES